MIRTHLGPVLRELARQRACVVEEGYLNLDHVHMLLSIPPTYAVAQLLGSARGRAPSPFPGPTSGGGRTSPDNSLGPAATTGLP